MEKFKGLLKSVGFQSFLWTQFLGAFNDNVFKIVLSMVAVNMASASMGGGGYVSLVGAIFILPFFIFSGYAGFVADVYNKRSVLIVTKVFEIVAVCFGLFAFWTGSIEFMLATLFLLACHSTFFGPAKYGIVPEMLPDRELSRANGLLEMSTFLAIILGTSAGTLMFSAWKDRLTLVGLVLVAISVIGTAVSFGIPRVPKSGAVKSFNLNPWSEITSGLRTLFRERFLLFTVIGITYFWFLGSLLQMDILLLGKQVMGLTDFWIGILIVFMAIGIGSGSIVAGQLSGDKVEPGLVPLGSIGMGVFSILLAWSPESYPRTAAALMMLGFSGGLFIVPLNALLQQRSAVDEKGRLIATNNFINTAGILSASGVLWVLNETFALPADRIMLIFGLITLASTVFVMKALPAFVIRFVLWMLTHTVYKIRVVGQENVPFKGPALLVCNHMSFVDGLLVGACVQRFIRFMVYRYFYDLKPIHWFLKLMKAVPVADAGKREVFKAITMAREELISGHVVCIFAEGEISRTGNLLPFKKGFERIVEGLDVPIIPVHLDRVWGSVFSFKGGRFFWKWPTHFPYPVTVSFGRPLKPGVTAQEVRQAVLELSSQAVEYRRAPNDLLHLKFIKKAKRRLFSLCMADSTGKSLTWGKALAASLVLSGWLRRNRKNENMIGLMLPATVAGALMNVASFIAGKIPINLNFTLGPEEFTHCVKEASIKTVVTSRAFLEKAGIEKTPEMVFIEEIARSITPAQRLGGALSSLLPYRLIYLLFCREERNPRKLATVIFTSGSTGVPKGVMLSHHNIISNIEGCSQILALSAKDRLLGTLPFFHSFGFTVTIWLPLAYGFGVVYHPNPMDAKAIGALARNYGATLMIGTPTFYSAYVRKCAREDFATIRYAVAGAEKLRDSVAKAFKEKFDKDLLEGYGATEMSPVVSVNVPDIEHEKQRQTGFKPGTVGHPIPGVSAKVVDVETGADLGPGREGMLLVKGPNLMLGYLNQPEKTREAIRDGWYVTGDLASIGEDGFIRIADRVSRFSKIGGEMIPHIKIEDMIAAHLGCDGAVTALPDEHKGERLVVFYTKKDLSPQDVWEALKNTNLPRLWLPKRENIFYVESIPLTATGKADLRKIKGMAKELAGV